MNFFKTCLWSQRPQSRALVTSNQFFFLGQILHSNNLRNFLSSKREFFRWSAFGNYLDNLIVLNFPYLHFWRWGKIWRLFGTKYLMAKGLSYNLETRVSFWCWSCHGSYVRACLGLCIFGGVRLFSSLVSNGLAPFVQSKRKSVWIEEFLVFNPSVTPPQDELASAPMLRTGS